MESVGEGNLNWRDRWKIERSLEASGQGHTHVAIEKSSKDGRYFFLKVLKDQRNAERRARMSREVAAYRTLKHASIPRLVDANTSLFEDPRAELYLVTEWIDGQTLSQLLSIGGPLDLASAATIADRLLETLEFCHAAEVVHRDIKPDNIVLRNSEAESPVLVDFGLSFNSDEPSSATGTLDELGNRFLRLPELAPHSPNKRDPRSDVTFVCGVLLFLLSGCAPAWLSNEHGELPHQRADVRKILIDRLNPADLRAVRRIFDKGFQPRIDSRWESAASLRKEIAPLRSPSSGRGISSASDWEAIEGYMQQPDALQVSATSDRLHAAIQSLLRARKQFIQRLGRFFVDHQTGHIARPQLGWAQTSLGFTRTGASDGSVEWHIFRAEVIGADMVIFADSTEIYRTPISELVFDQAFVSAVEAQFGAMVRKVLPADGSIASS